MVSMLRVDQCTNLKYHEPLSSQTGEVHIGLAGDVTRHGRCPYENGSSERSKEIINQHRAVNAALMKTRGIKPV